LLVAKVTKKKVSKHWLQDVTAIGFDNPAFDSSFDNPALGPSFGNPVFDQSSQNSNELHSVDQHLNIRGQYNKTFYP
jgi:hypothetical protein